VIRGHRAHRGELAVVRRERGVPTLLLNAVLPASSSRLRAPARQLLAPYYRQLAAVGAVTADHAARFAELGVPSPRAHVTGDARFDQVWTRVHASSPNDVLVARLRDAEALTLVAGSTWPEDESVVLDALSDVTGPKRWRVIIAPHEPAEAHLRMLERRLVASHVDCARLVDVEATRGFLPQVVLVDRVGVLADLYRVGDVAYVGGGFHSAGLHSVVEPAALAMPVLYGPRNDNAREAAELAQAGGGRVVRNAEELRLALEAWSVDDAARARDGQAAEAYVRSELGASSPGETPSCCAPSYRARRGPAGLRPGAVRPSA
jgi:3-deoxy-D-manno-octulosonic-acid transferase